jgi:hypothetical protein
VIYRAEPSFIEGQLSEEARLLLIAAALAPSGMILNVMDSAGTHIVTNGGDLVEDESRVASWSAAHHDLISFRLDDPQGDRERRSR